MKYKVSVIAILVSLGFSSIANAQTPVETIATPVAKQAHQLITTNSISKQFRPKSWTDERSLDYSIWDDILHNIVVDFGPSARIWSRRPPITTGTRATHGHISPYRLEGSRIAFGFLNDNYKDGLTEYREDLVNIANKIDMTRMSKDEQLAFWFNLHNVLLIEKIAQEYPEDRPSTLMFDINGVEKNLHDAKFINIRGTDLSLRNIREDIVFSNWSNPIVMYGFFRGDIGSPRMARLAFTAENLEYRLNGNAYEFINALRGFHESRRTRKVSAIYDEVRPFYFKDWEKDLSAHIQQHAEGKTLEDFKSIKPFELDRYDTKIADLSGGERRASALFLQGSENLPPDVVRLLREVETKHEILKKRGVRLGYGTGYVIIDDIETSEDKVDGETIK